MTTSTDLIPSTALTYAAEVYRALVFDSDLPRDDKPAMAEAWNDLIDSMNKNGDVSDHEAFHCPDWTCALELGVELCVPSCDPQDTLKAINDPDVETTAREECVEELAEWIAGGGQVFINAGNITDEAMGWLEGLPSYPVAAAVRVAIANDDRSGLQGLGYEIA